MLNSKIKKIILSALLFGLIITETAFSQRNDPIPPTPSPTNTPDCIPEEVIKEGVEYSCQEPYSCYHSCSSYVCSFDKICEDYGNPNLCKAGNIYCSNPSGAHSVAIIYVCTRKEWCIISAQNGQIAGCVPLPNIFTDRMLCRAMNRPYPCDCEYEQFNVFEDEVNYANPSYCSKNRSDFGKCTACCESTIDYHCSRRDPLADQWMDDCIGSCKNYHGDHPYSPKPTATPRCTPTQVPTNTPVATPTKKPRGRFG